MLNIFKSAAAALNGKDGLAEDALRLIPVSRDAAAGESVDFVHFATPKDVMVSRWYPGYRTTDLTGANADEAIALLLGNALQSQADLEGFRRLLATPDIASAIIADLLPRQGVPVKQRNYVMSEEMIATRVDKELAARGSQFGRAAVSAYTYAITRVLAGMSLVAKSTENRMVSVADSFVIKVDDLRRIMMVESMRGIFSETRIQQATRALDQDATPQVIAERIGDMFRQFSFAIPEIKLRLEQLDIAVQMVRIFNLTPGDVPNSISTHPSLIALSSIANFLVFSEDSGAISMPGVAATEVRAACDAVLTTIQSAPSMEVISLQKFAEFFGEVPAASPDGIRRGLVMYSVAGQTSKMEVADVIPKKDGAAMALVDPTYVRAAGIASAISGQLLTPSAMAGLANIVADEMAMSPLDLGDDCAFDPLLATIQVSQADLMFVALARASSVAFVKVHNQMGPVQGSGHRLNIVFGCTVAEQWRTTVFAATPSTAYLADPAAVIVYTSKMIAREPVTLPSRQQTIGLEYNRDVHYLGDVEQLLDKSIERQFSLRLPVSPYGGEPIPLTLKVSVLGLLVGTADVPVDRGTAYYAAVREPGVDRELRLMLGLALSYAQLAADDINGDKARSWLIVHLAPIMMHPAVRIMAETAVNAAVIEAKLDGRKLAPQMRELYSRAFFGTALAVLNRFGKIDGSLVLELTKAIPVSTLTLQAALTLAQLPNAINGSSATLNRF